MLWVENNKQRAKNNMLQEEKIRWWNSSPIVNVVSDIWPSCDYQRVTNTSEKNMTKYEQKNDSSFELRYINDPEDNKNLPDFTISYLDAFF